MSALRPPGRHAQYLAAVAVAAAVAIATVVIQHHTDSRPAPERSAMATVSQPPAGAVGAQAAPLAALPLSPGAAVAGDRVLGGAASVDLSGAPTAPAAIRPTSLDIAAIGVHTSLVDLGRNADGTAQVPTSTTVAGWYAEGPAPGQPGPAVILGHVDSYTGPAIFFGLHELRPGALVRVGEGARTLTFAVTRVDTYAKAAFPTTAVFGPTPERALRLVTCGGTFDTTTRHYDDNVVVYATEVA